MKKKEQNSVKINALPQSGSFFLTAKKREDRCWHLELVHTRTHINCSSHTHNNTSTAARTGKQKSNNTTHDQEQPTSQRKFLSFFFEDIEKNRIAQHKHEITSLKIRSQRHKIVLGWDDYGRTRRNTRDTHQKRNVTTETKKTT